MEAVGSPLLQYVAAIFGDLALTSSGMHYGWPSPSLPQLVNNTNSTINLTSEEGGWMAVMPLIGAVVGALAAANLVDYFGRKKVIIMTGVPFFIAWIMIAFANHVAVLHVARFLAGSADGIAFTVVPMYIGEIAEPTVRGVLGSSCSVSWIVGFLLINIIGSYLSISITAIISSVIPILSIITFIWMPESPYFLLMRKQSEKARESLRRFRGKYDVDAEISRMRTAIDSELKTHGSFLDLFTVKSNRRAVIIIAGLRGFQQFSGTTAINFYLQEIFSHAGDNLAPHHASMAYFTVQLFMTIISSSLVDKTGRKPLLIISMAGSALALLIEGSYFYVRNELNYDTSAYEFVPVAGLIGFVVIFSLGMQSIPVCMLGELFPTSVKAFALCLADVYYSIVATMASKFLQISKDHFGIHMAFFGFAISSVIGLVFIVFCVPETKGKSLEEIQRYLKGEDEVEASEIQYLNPAGKKLEINGHSEIIA